MQTAVDLSDVSILVAEDDEANFFLVKILLSELSVKVLHAWDGEEVIKMFKRNPSIDLILMDIRMPNIDGYEATVEIRKFDKSVPIIAQTGYVFEEGKQKAKLLGFNDYLCKPLSEADLISVIRKHIDKKKLS